LWSYGRAHLAVRAVALAENYDLVGADLFLDESLLRHLRTSVVCTSLVFAFGAWDLMGGSDAGCEDEYDEQGILASHYVKRKL